MTFTKEIEERTWQLDRTLRLDGIAELFFTGDGSGLRDWYGRLLSSFAVAWDGRDIVFASTVVDGASARFLIVTDLAVMLADVRDMSADENVPVQLEPITAITALSVTASMTNSPGGYERPLWPGVITIDATLRSLGQVRFVGESFDRTRDDKVGDISRLLLLLRTHLDV